MNVMIMDVEEMDGRERDKDQVCVWGSHVLFLVIHTDDRHRISSEGSRCAPLYSLSPHRN